MTYPGGKSGAGVYQKIINLMPPHERYIEPFFGAGAIMRLKRPAQQNIGVELDPDVIKAWTPLPHVQLIKGDGIVYLQQHRFTSRDLIYCDPPYLNRTRRTPRSAASGLIHEQVDETVEQVRPAHRPGQPRVRVVVRRAIPVAVGPE